MPFYVLIIHQGTDMVHSMMHGNIQRKISVIIAIHHGSRNLEMGDIVHALQIKPISLSTCMQVHFTQEAVLIQ